MAPGPIQDLQNWLSLQIKFWLLLKLISLNKYEMNQRIIESYTNLKEYY